MQDINSTSFLENEGGKSRWCVLTHHRHYDFSCVGPRKKGRDTIQAGSPDDNGNNT